ncbi:hypothetical protein J3D43_005992 [Paenibacillus xylanexedens]|nr:hypothetical protein [Paenibacillus xylanexedens]MCP1427476.1 hypothetical protein [Paenibacillus xylanexedens]
MPKTVEALWKIELLYGKHPSYTERTYAVKLTTKLEGELRSAPWSSI